MKVELREKPKNATIIEGFPGFGLVGTIVTEFLIKHLKAKQIGRIWSEDLLPVAAVHGSEVVDPLGVFYDKKNNIIILHALSEVKGLEWKISAGLVELCKELNAKEIISVEGVASENSELGLFYFTENDESKKKLESLGIKPLTEGLVMGVTGALMLQKEKKLSCMFVESKVGLADSKAAAKIVESLDKYLGLKVDTAPLLKAAEKFEKILKTVIEKSKKPESKEGTPSYVG